MQHMVLHPAPIGTASSVLADSYRSSKNSGEGKAYTHRLRRSVARESQMKFKAELV